MGGVNHSHPWIIKKRLVPLIIFRDAGRNRRDTKLEEGAFEENELLNRRIFPPESSITLQLSWSYDYRCVLAKNPGMREGGWAIVHSISMSGGK